MKKKCIVCIALIAVLAFPLAAKQPDFLKMKPNYDFGIGLDLGTPTAVAIDYHLDSFDIVGGVNLGFLSGNSLCAEAGCDFPLASFDWTEGFWDLSCGVVGDVGIFKSDDKTEVLVASFAPISLRYTFPKAPWSLKLKIAPGVRFLPEIGPDVQGSIGFRYLF